MLSFFTSRLNIAILVSVVIMLAGSFWYWNYSQNRFAEYERQISQYEEVIANQTRVIVRLQDDITQIQSINTRLRGIDRQNQERMETLRRELNSLESLSNDPTRRRELEDDLNRMSSQRNRCLEVSTGSIVREQDLSNTLCSSLMEERYESNQ